MLKCNILRNWENLFNNLDSRHEKSAACKHGISCTKCVGFTQNTAFVIVKSKNACALKYIYSYIIYLL